MKAIILAAGRGSRMKDLTENKPKCLIEIDGKTLLSLQLNALHAAGINDIAIVTGYKRELLINYNLVEFHNSRWAETNMVSSLVCAQEWLMTGPCIVSYSDIFYNHTAVESLINCMSPLAITYDPNWLTLWTKRFGNPLLDAETFKLDFNKNLLEIGNLPSSLNEIEGQYMGLLRFTPQSWVEVLKILSSLSSQDCDKIHMTGILQKVIEEKRMSVAALPYQGIWGEIDSAEDLEVFLQK